MFGVKDVKDGFWEIVLGQERFGVGYLVLSQIRGVAKSLRTV